MNQGARENPLQSVRAWLDSIRHFRWWIAFGTVAMMLVSFTVIAMLPNVYQATTTILVDPQKVPDKYVNATVSTDLNQRVNMISQEVLSATRLQQIIDKLHLGEGKKPSSKEDLIDGMRKVIKIEVKQTGGGSLSAFTISYQGSSPALVAQVANELASSFIEWNLESREQQAVGTTEFLTAQLQQAKRTLEEQENKLREFKTAHPGEMPENQTTNLAMIGQLQTQLQATSDALNRADLQRTLLLRSDTAPANPGAVPLTERGRLQAEQRQLESKLHELRRRYTAEFPDVIEATQRLERVKEALAALPPEATPEAVAANPAEQPAQMVVLDKEIARLRAEQGRIQDQMRNYHARLEATPLREQQIAELTRNYETSKTNYASLLEKTFSAEMAADLERKQKAERFTILDPARVPERPVKPRRLLLMLAASIGSLFLSMGLAIAKDTVDSTVKTEADVKSLIPAATTVLTVVPDIETIAEVRKRRMILMVAACVTVVAFLAEAALIWKLHPLFRI